MDLGYQCLIDEELVGKFYEKKLRKTNQEEFVIEKVKGYHNSFNCWIDKNDVI